MKHLLLILALLVSTVAFASGPPGQNHGINLTWTEGTGNCSFNVYKGTSTGGENYSAPYASVGVGVLVFLDQTGTAGTKYYYTVTSVLNGIESSPSGEVSANYPTVPVPPVVTATPQ
ncbi:MAG: hypothetical protein ABSH01_25175 [Terriglobia bacterium]|jgi:hypothetical protein